MPYPRRRGHEFQSWWADDPSAREYAGTSPRSRREESYFAFVTFQNTVAGASMLPPTVSRIATGMLNWPSGA